MSKDQITGGQVAQFISLTQEHSLSSIDIQNLYNSGFLTDILKVFKSGNTLPSRLELQKLLGLNTGLSNITLDYSQSLEQMLEAGKYNWVNDNITRKNFPLKGEGKVEFKPEIIHFNRYTSSEDVLKELDKMGLRAGNLEELLAFGAINPDEQRKHPIVALGASCRIYGSRLVPYLGGDDSRRDVCLGCWVGDWYAGGRFLAVAKPACR